MASHSSTFSLLFTGGVSGSLKNSFAQIRNSAESLRAGLERVNRTSGQVQEYKKLSDNLNRLRVKMQGVAVLSKSEDARLTKSVGRLRDLSGEYKKLTAEVQRLQTKSGMGHPAAKGELSQTLAQLKKVKAEYQKTSATVGQLQGKLNAGQNKARAEFEQTAAKVRELSSDLQKAGVGMDNLAKSERRLAAQAANLQQRQAHMGRAGHYRDMRQNAFAGWQGLVGTALAVGGPIKAAVDFESKMADVKKVVNFDTPQQFQQMGQDLLMMSTRIPMSADGLADIVAAAGQSGVAQGELKRFAESAAKMGVAFDVSGGKAGKIMADWRAGMKLSQDEAEELADEVNHLSNNMNATAPALAEVIQRQGAVAKTAGLAKEDIASLGAALLSSGAAPEIAATAMKNFTNALSKGSAMSKTQKKAFASIGFGDTDNLAKDMQKDARGTILKVMEALGKAPKHQRSALVGQMFGEEAKGAIMPLLVNLDNLRKAFELTSDPAKYTGSMLREFTERAATSGNALELLKNTIRAVGITLGALLLPAVRKAATAIGRFLVRIMELAQKYPRLTEGIVKVAAALATAGAAFLAFGMIGKFVVGGLGEAFHLLQALKLALVANPWFMAAAGILAVVLALYKLGALDGIIAKLKQIGPAFLEGLTGSLKEAFAVFEESLAPGIKALEEALAPLKDMFKGPDDTDLTTWKALGQFLGDLAGLGLENIGRGLSVIAQALAWLGETLGKVAGALSMGDLVGAVKELENAFKPLKEVIQGALIAGEEMMEKLRQAILQKMRDVYQSFVQTWEEIKTLLSNIDLSDLGAKIMGSLLNGLKSMAGSVKGAVSDAVNFWGEKLGLSDSKAKAGGGKGQVDGTRASGGPVRSGLTYLVGERGPELFSPLRNGWIIPRLAQGFDFPELAAFQQIQHRFAEGRALARQAERFVSRPMPGPKAGGGHTINFSPVIHIHTNGGDQAAIRQAVNQGLAQGKEELRRMLAEIERDDRRGSYA